jgi:hypothetical protein
VDIDGARRFDGFPLYWLGDRFEGLPLTHLELANGRGFATLHYGSCTPSGAYEPSCTDPLQLQISPLCLHLREVARDQVWRRRRIRGAPVGTIDSAPVLLSQRVQVKVYIGEGATPGLALRALRALRSINQEEPVISASDAIPGAPRDVLGGNRRCREAGQA